MSIPNFFPSPSVLTIVLLFQIVSSHTQIYVYHSCSNSTHFATNDPYETNLETVLNFLSREAHKSGFSSLGLGKDDTNTVYGHALCRGDVSLHICRTCVRKSIDGIRKRCPNNKRAVIWYEKCFLKYSDTEFFGHIDRENVFVITTSQRRSNNELFYHKRNALLNQLASEAPMTPKRCAAEKLVISESVKLFAFAQCTEDLSLTNCTQCLYISIARLSKHEVKMGVYVISGSCTVRYETYPFSNIFNF